MVNMPKDWPIEEYKDVASQNKWKEASASGQKAKIDLAWKTIQTVGRDHARTPM